MEEWKKGRERERQRGREGEALIYLTEGSLDLATWCNQVYHVSDMILHEPKTWKSYVEAFSPDSISVTNVVGSPSSLSLLVLLC
jgi:hypothetical protein